MPRMTVNDLDHLPDDGWQYELVDGRLVRMPLGGGEASGIAAILLGALITFVRAHKLGWVTGADGGYDFSALGQPDTELGPDVAFVRADQVPTRTSPEYARAWPVAPDLAVEVASPNQYRPEMAAKAQRYLAAGVRLVWVIWPRYQQVDVWRPDDTEARTVLTSADTLDGLDVVPGFTFPVAELFS
jgi:Uma2 family endonuclease